MLGRSAKNNMSKKKIDLQAKSLGEKWFEKAVNSTPNLWFSGICLVFGIVSIIFHFMLSDMSSAISFLGPVWVALSLLHFERYHAMRAITKLIKDYDSQSLKNNPLNETQQVTSTMKPKLNAEQGAVANPLRRRSS
jgi:hypothetical protein